MPRGIRKDAPLPDEGMLDRARQGGFVPCCPDKDEIKKYIKRRLAEGNLSVNRCAREMGMTRIALQLNLTIGHSTSYEFLGKMLWIVDGEDCPLDYGRVLDYGRIRG